MIEPKFHPYFTEYKAETENGFEYVALSPDTPKELLDEYKIYLKRQDDLVARGKRVFL